MKESPPPNIMENEAFESKQLAAKYHSVEFSIQGVELAYQFKIWNTSSTPMCVLIREDSAILPSLKEGDTLNLKFYSKGTSHSRRSGAG